MRVDVHVPFALLIARITRLPFPSMKTFGLEALQGAALEPGEQYTSNSALPQPPPPTSKVQLVGSGWVPAGPSNSSLHAGVHCACVGRAVVISRKKTNTAHREIVEIRPFDGPSSIIAFILTSIGNSLSLFEAETFHSSRVYRG